MCASCLPSALTWIKAATRPQYSKDVLEKKDAGHNFVCYGAVEQPAIFSRHWIALGLIRERENIRRKEDRRSRLGVARRLSETVVKAAATCPGNVGEHSVQRHLSVFVGIKTLVKKVAQKAPVLRNAFSIHTHSGSNGIRSMLNVRGKISYRREAATSYYRVRDNMNIFVDLPWLKAAVQMNKTIARCEFALNSVRKLPLSSWNYRTLRIARIAGGKRVAGIVR